MSRIFTSWSHPLPRLSHPCLLVFCLLTCSLQASSELPFHIECPPDVTVDCNAELWDLSIYGNATVYGYGSPVSAGPPESEVYNLNSCGTGTIVRTWVAHDYSGTAHSCSQTIYVGTGSSGYVNIQWPPDYVINSCSPQTHPQALPPPYDFPVIDDNAASCVQLMMNYDDLVFDLNPPACQKILREWTVIDWCQYDPNAYYPQGIWTHTQIIKIVPEHPPILYCPSDTVVTAGGDCTGGHVSLDLASGSSDCGAGVLITNHSPYAYEHGADASGFYPLGTTKVVFTADDGCGGTTTCHMYVTVQDMKKPTPVCYYGVTVSLMQMPDGYYLDLRPDFFNKGSFDNCTPPQDLTYSVEPSRVSCAELGETPVKMYVTDASGNSAYCNTVVHVQDNMNMCPSTSGVIDGTVHTMSGVMLPDVAVSLQNHSASVMTDEAGEYAFESVDFGDTYTVTPEATSDMTGVTSVDLVILLKHILGIERFDHPYLYVAADLDESSYVSVNDLLELKELILLNHHDLQAATSWKFIEDNFEFTDPFNPLAEAIPHGYTIDVLTQDMTDLNFTGIKMGDLSGDAIIDAGVQNVATRSGGVSLVVEDQVGKAGEIMEIPVFMTGLQGTMAVQFALKSDPEVGEIVEVEPGNLHGVDASSFGLSHLDMGILPFVWFDLEPASSDEGEVMRIHVRLARDASVQEVLLGLDNDVLPATSYNEEYQPFDVHIAFNGNIPVPQQDHQDFMLVGSNYPNPFDGSTIIPVTLEEDARLEMVVFAANGKELLAREIAGVKGLQEITVDRRQLAGYEGMMFCRISSDRHIQTIRMMALNTSN